MAITMNGSFKRGRFDHHLFQKEFEAALGDNVEGDYVSVASAKTEVASNMSLLSTSSEHTAHSEFPDGYNDDTARYLCSHTSAAHCGYHNVPLLECGCASKQAKVPGFRYVVRVLSEKSDASAFCGYDDTRQLILAAFRGSASLKQWKSLLFIAKNHQNLAPVEGYPPNVKVHTGFLLTYASIREKIIASVQKLKEDYPGYRVYLTGHSLGGEFCCLF